MKKLLYVLAGVAAVAALWFIFEYHPCKEPGDLQVAVVGLNCALDFFNRPVQDVRADACKYLGREPGCQLAEDDKVKVLEMIDEQVAICAKKRLAAEGFCTDKVTKKGLRQ